MQFLKTLLFHICFVNQTLTLNLEPMINWNDVIKYANQGVPAPDKRVEKTEVEWKAELSEEDFYITRKKGTERAGTGALCSAHEAGKYSCKCCDTELFDSTIKFESGSGWPSFTAPIKDNAVKYDKDESFGMVRVEVMCNGCDSHLGHVFPDGPQPSGLRYCMNSASLKLIKEKVDYEK
ncbi:MAG: peptide-methionine (R)-S-oxide reductase [Vicingaceae bacterium]